MEPSREPDGQAPADREDRADTGPGGGSRRPASAVVAVGLVGVIAAIVATGFVGLTRWAPSSGAAERGNPGLVDEEPPEELAGGREPPSVPGDVAEAADGPVVAVASLEALPEGVHCPPDDEVAWTEPPEVRQVLLTPEGLQARLVGRGRHRDVGPRAPPPEEPAGRLREPPRVRPGPQAVPEREAMPEREAAPDEPDAAGRAGPGPDGRARADEDVPFVVSCEAEWDGANWRNSGGSVTRAEQAPFGGGGHTAGASCCDADGVGTAHAEVAVGNEVAWLLQDRGGYWLAYPTEGLSVVTVSWRFRPQGFGGGPGFDEPGMGQGSTFVRLLDEDGDVVDERWVG